MAALAGGLAYGSAPARAVGEDDKKALEAAEPADWDQVATIKGAAERLGRLHRAKGAKAAYELIDNCYKTHSISKSYSEGFEICITQDYLETRTLIQVYSRMPPEALSQAGVPSPAELAKSMGQRITTAFRHYGKTQEYADGLKRLIDVHGFPVFVTLVFPEAARADQGGNSTDKSKDKKSAP